MKETTNTGGTSRCPAQYGRLTARELEVLNLLAEGLSNKMIGRRLGIAAATVKCHIGKVLGALGAASRLEAVIIASRIGLLGNALTTREGARAEEPHAGNARADGRISHRARR